MFCPKCKAEYVAGVTTCWDCQVSLVDALPEPDKKGRRGAARLSKAQLEESREQLAQPLELVTVLEATDVGQAMLAGALLREADIRFTSSGAAKQGSGGWGGITDLIGGQIVLQVRREDAERALAILSDLESYRQEASGDADDE